MKQLFVLIHILFLLQEVTQTLNATAVTDRVKHQSGPQKVRESGRGDTLDSWNTQDDLAFRRYRRRWTIERLCAWLNKYHT